MSKTTAPKKKTEPAKTKREIAAEDKAKLALLVAKLEKDYGAGIIQTSSGTSSLQKLSRQVPSGSVGLDIAIGPMYRNPNGMWQVGFPPGRIIEVFGPEGCGKTTLCLQLVANAQAMGIRCAFNDMEHAVDPDYAKALGVDMTKLYLSQPSSGEQCLQIVETELLSGLFGLIIVDSVAALIPESELKGDMGDATMGGQARLMGQAMRKLSSALTPACNIVFTNQIRYKVGVMYGNPETTPGGQALKFFAGVRLDVRRGDALKQGENQYGHVIRCNIIKNKVAPPFRKCEFPLIYGKGIDYVAELFDLCLGRGMIMQAGAWFSHNGTNIGQGRDACIDVMRSNRRLAYTLYDQLLTTVMMERGYNTDGSPIPGMHQELIHTSQAAQFQPLTDEELEAALAAEAGHPVPMPPPPVTVLDADPTGEESAE